MKTIDITPTWGSILPVLLDIIEQGGGGVREAKEEIMRLGKAVDDANKTNKKGVADAV
jgi:hypothetical protein